MQSLQRFFNLIAFSGPGFLGLLQSLRLQLGALLLLCFPLKTSPTFLQSVITLHRTGFGRRAGGTRKVWEVVCMCLQSHTDLFQLQP